MMLAMCVRKTGDATTQPTALQSHHKLDGPAKRKHKNLKALKTSRKEERREEPERALQKVKDDEDGHLIYHKGDVLESRCTYLSDSLSFFLGCSPLLEAVAVTFSNVHAFKRPCLGLFYFRFFFLFYSARLRRVFTYCERVPKR